MQEREQRDQRVYKLASSILGLMREHPNRAEAFDACDVAQVLFRKPKPAISHQGPELRPESPQEPL